MNNSYMICINCGCKLKKKVGIPSWYKNAWEHDKSDEEYYPPLCIRPEAFTSYNTNCNIFCRKEQKVVNVLVCMNNCPLQHECDSFQDFRREVREVREASYLRQDEDIIRVITKQLKKEDQFDQLAKEIKDGIE